MPSEPPPFLRIAAALRDRIADGDLPAGARLPSVRDLVRRHGVAIATATKAVETLRREGLVRSVPRVGTVVDEQAARRLPRPHRPKPDTEPTVRLIVEAACEIADFEGLAGVSMRAVSAHIGTSTMSLYRYVVNKDDLIARMIDACFRRLEPPGPDTLGWRAKLELLHRRVWAVFRAHPWLADVVSLTRVQPIPGLIAVTEATVDALAELRLDSHTALYVNMIMFSYARGLAAGFEAQIRAESETGVRDEDWTAQHEPSLHAMLASGRYPAFAAVIAGLDTDYDQDLDVLFEFGSRAILDGLEARLVGPQRDDQPP